MATLSITKTYDDTVLLDETDLDPFINNSETFFNTTKLNNDNIQNSGITASTKIADGSITTAKFQSNSIVEAGIAASAVTTAKINDSAVTTAKIADSNVTTAKINDSAVTTAKIADSNVTNAKITPNYSLKAVPSIGSTTSSQTITVIESDSLTLNSRPVLIQAVQLPFNIDQHFSTTSTATINIKRGSTTIGSFEMQNSTSSNSASLLNLVFLDTTGASGATTYKLEVVYTTSVGTSFSLPTTANLSNFIVQEL